MSNDSKKLLEIQYVSALPGTGKTFSLLKRISAGYKKQKRYIIAVPSVKLLLQIASHLRENHKIPDSFAIFSGADALDDLIDRALINDNNMFRNVSSQFEQALSENRRVILVTHIALKRFSIATLKKCQDYRLIIDEAFSLGDLSILNLDNTVKEEGIFNTFIKGKPFFTDEELQDDSIKRLKVSDKKAFTEYLNNPDSKDAIDITKTKNLLVDIADPTKIVFMKKMPQSKDGNHSIAVYFNPHILKNFKSVLVISAFFEYTALYHYLNLFFNLQDITDSFELRSLKHRYKKLMLYPLYVSDVYQKYSKYLRNISRFCKKEDYPYVSWYYDYHNKKFDKDRTLTFQQFVELIESECEVFNGALRNINEDDKKYHGYDEENEERSWIPLSLLSHGQNSYQDSTSILSCFSCNAKPHEKAFLKSLLEDYDIWFDRTLLTILQNLCRTAVRDYDSDEYVHALVPDIRSAQVIQSILKYPKILTHCLNSEYTLFIGAQEKKVELPKDYHPSTHLKNGKLRSKKKVELPKDYHPSTHLKNGKLRSKKKVELPKDYHPSTHLKNGKRKQTPEERKQKRKESMRKLRSKEKESKKLSK